MLKRKKVEALEKKLKIKFKDIKTLEQALVHRSYLNETRGQNLESNERLEFLGDAILEFIVSQWLFEQFPDYPEGDLTNLRSNLVKTDSLAKIAGELNIGENLQLSRGEKASGGQQNRSLLANTLEAIIGAIYLDQGIKASTSFVKKNFLPLLEKFLAKGEFKDFKSILQEKTQAQVKESPVYKIIKEIGPDHDKTFTTAVYIQNKLIAKGIGKSKQAAEEEGARLALRQAQGKLEKLKLNQ